MLDRIDQSSFYDWKCFIADRETLVLKQLGLMDDAVINLAKQLKNNQTVKSLDLSGNRITNKGAKALAKQLEKNQTVQSLNLSGNKITNECVKAFTSSFNIIL